MSMQPYMMILGDIIVPITPGKITTKYKGKNKTVELVDGRIINKLNPPGLVNYSFTLILPKKTDLPFANRIYNPQSGEYVKHMEQDFYLNYLYDVFKNNKTILFTIWRTDIGGGRDMGLSGIDASGNGIITNKCVTIENYSLEENAANGLDIEADIELQEYVGYGTRKITYSQNSQDGTTVAAVTNTRSSDNKTIPATYTVKSGDCLINICKKELGDASKWKEIAELNNLSNPNKIYVGQVLKLR